MNSAGADTTAIIKAQNTQIDKIRESSGHEMSSHAFVSLYLWQKEMDLSISLQENFFTVRCGMYGDNAWFFPCGDEDEIYSFIKSHISDRTFSLCYLRECDVKWLQDKFPDEWEFIRDEASDEYIGDISEYISLEGSKFSGIRKKLRKIDKNYQVTAKVICDENIDDALSVISIWNSRLHNVGDNGLTDDEVSASALRDRQFLDISGVILYLDSVPVSVFAGFPLNCDTLDVVVGKCIPNPPDGTIYYALREYLKHCRGDYVYYNGEEDLGIEGIRYIKNKLRPVRKNQIWRAVSK
ncbi:MAG: DUF2156 domain-containing protein [Oscillospiraceae bacterium]|nr:DUF2156 domain-containing protein [Oscillospiraceae bacterium]